MQNELEEAVGAGKVRRSGILKLYFSHPGDPAEPDSPAVPAYAPFRLCRGFLDDLNRDLPIRMRIRLEKEIAKGFNQGLTEGAASGQAFRWEFTPG